MAGAQHPPESDPGSDNSCPLTSLEIQPDPTYLVMLRPDPEDLLAQYTTSKKENLHDLDANVRSTEDASNEERLDSQNTEEGE